MSDPLEPFNRAMFAFNDAVLDDVIYPIGGLAQVWLSDSVRQAARNMYSNLSEPEFIATNLLQGNFSDAGVALERVAVNSTLGIAGIFDPATGLGLVAREPEFSEAVCSLGVPAGAYLVVPLVGPSNLNSGAVLSALWVGHLYVLGLISTTLLAADMVIDVTVGAAMLRHSVDPLDAASADAYAVQRSQYDRYIETACAEQPATPSAN